MTRSEVRFVVRWLSSMGTLVLATFFAAVGLKKVAVKLAQPYVRKREASFKKFMDVARREPEYPIRQPSRYRRPSNRR